MRNPRWLLLALAAPLAASQPYQPPADGVELKLENFTRENHLVAHFYDGVDACNKAQSIGKVEKSLLTSVKPGQPVTLSLRGRRADISDPSACSVFFTFRPEAGFSYRASLQMYDGQCRLGFSKVELASNTASTAQRFLRTYKEPILPSQGVCRKLDAEQRSKLGL
jgi:hypothetical protein